MSSPHAYPNNVIERLRFADAESSFADRDDEFHLVVIVSSCRGIADRRS
jgi:hypothetical protein